MDVEENEHYDNTSDVYLFRGAVKSDEDGKYAFRTIVPVPYKVNPDNENSWRPAHIHMRVSVADQQDLITQIYFKGDKYNETDGSTSSPQAVNRILEIVKNSTGEHSVTFDVVLSIEFPLDQEVYKKITGLYRMDNNNTLEFIKSDDSLLMKRNGQLITSFKYIGNNTFESGSGSLKVTFELLPKGDTKVVVITRDNTYTGEEFLKYSDLRYLSLSRYQIVA